MLRAFYFILTFFSLFDMYTQLYNLAKKSFHIGSQKIYIERFELNIIILNNLKNWTMIIVRSAGSLELSLEQISSEYRVSISNIETTIKTDMSNFWNYIRSKKGKSKILM